MATNYWQQKIHLDWNKDGIKSISNKLKHDEIETLSNNRKRAKAIIAICARIGDRLQSIEVPFGYSNIYWKDDEFVSIGRLCPNISSITFDDNPPDEGQYCTDSIRFDSFQCLKELHFPPRTCINSSVLNSIPKSIEILTGVNGDSGRFFERIEDFCNFFRDHPALIEIEADHLYSADGGVANIFPIIAEFCPRLKKINLIDCQFTFDGIECLEGMKVLKLDCTDRSLQLSDDQMIQICNRNPGLEEIDLNWHHIPMTIRAFESISGLKKLRDLFAVGWIGVELSSDEQQRIVQKLLTNSGASLQHLCLFEIWFLTTRTIEMMAELCPVLRNVKLSITSESATPESIRYLIDRIVGRPEWNPNRDKLQLRLWVKCGHREGAEAAFAPFEALNHQLKLSFRIEFCNRFNRLIRCNFLVLSASSLPVLLYSILCIGI